MYLNEKNCSWEFKWFYVGSYLLVCNVYFLLLLGSHFDVMSDEDDKREQFNSVIY